MPKLKVISSLALVLSDVSVALILTLFLLTWAPKFNALGFQGFILLFVLTSAFVALVTVVSLSFARPNAAAKRVIAARDMAIFLREQALNEHTIVSISRPDGRIAAVNQNFVDTLGYAAEDVIGQTSDFFHVMDDPNESQRINAIVSQGQSWKGQQRLRTRDGSCLIVETTILPRFDDNGVFENAISIRTDLSKAIAEGAVAGRNAVVESLPDEVYIYRPDDFRLIYANAKGRRRFRRELDDLRDRSLLDFFSEAERRLFKRHIGPVLTGETEIARIVIDHIGKPVEILSHVDRGPDGTRSLVSVVRDISERRQADQIKLSSVATVSHELRTPLTSIKGALRLLESGVVGNLGSEATRMVKVARRNSDRLLSIVNDILVLEKLTSGEMPFETRRVDLAALLLEAAEENAAFATECNVEFWVEPATEPAWVEADPDRLMQVLSNLMSNAAKFAPAGSKVELRVEDREDVWRVCVADKGPGIPKEAHATLFDTFTQVAGAEKSRHNSTGLGLAICREIIGRHGGQIAFDTKVGVGSTFYFELEKSLFRVISAEDADATNVA